MESLLSTFFLTIQIIQSFLAALPDFKKKKKKRKDDLTVEEV